jgi:hypothetical protein
VHKGMPPFASGSGVGAVDLVICTNIIMIVKVVGDSIRNSAFAFSFLDRKHHPFQNVFWWYHVLYLYLGLAYSEAALVG